MKRELTAYMQKISPQHMKLLIVDDNIQLVDSLRDNLKDRFKIDFAYTGAEGLAKALSNTYDLIVLDLDLPDKKGSEVCRQIRLTDMRVPILILSGIQDAHEKARLLDVGADDYIVKPFNVIELRARLQALLRRAPTAQADVLVYEDLSIDVGKRVVSYQGTPIELRRMEMDILEYLVRNRGRVVTRKMISDHVASTGRANWSNAIDVHIKHLRDKLEQPLGRQFIVTVYGVGYTIKP